MRSFGVCNYFTVSNKKPERFPLISKIDLGVVNKNKTIYLIVHHFLLRFGVFQI